MTEKIIHQQVCDYLNLQYPNVIYTSDASGMRVSIGLRMELKRKRCKRFVIPDLIILHPSNGWHGLILEIKKDGEKLIKKDGEFKKGHISEQADTIGELTGLGYCAMFGIGFSDCKKIIDGYFKTTTPKHF